MNKSIKKKRGRPAGYRTENPHTARLAVNVTPDKLTTYKQAAKASGSNFSAWVRGALDKEAK